MRPSLWAAHSIQSSLYECGVVALEAVVLDSKIHARIFGFRKDTLYCGCYEPQALFQRKLSFAAHNGIYANGWRSEGLCRTEGFAAQATWNSLSSALKVVAHAERRDP